MWTEVKRKRKRTGLNNFRKEVKNRKKTMKEWREEW
jgi:hypothetical protein